MRPFACDPPDMIPALAGLLRSVPKGCVATFGDLAAGLGDRNAAVWCGTVARRPPDAWRDVPLHRAVRASGECVSPGQPELLAGEGAPVDGNRADLAACRFSAFPVPGPLAAPHAEQAAIADRVVVAPDDAPAPAGPVAAVDVAYPSPERARAAYVEMAPSGEGPDGDEPAFSLAVESRARFPYVSGLLAYRELPAYAALFDRLCELGRDPGVILVDGNGVLHPRRCGVASALGVLADVPTVGVAKKKLCGSVVAGGAVELDGEPVGRALANPAISGGNPVFVSPGHRVSLRAAADVAGAWFRGHRLPEPVFLADRLSKTRSAPKPRLGEASALGASGSGA